MPISELFWFAAIVIGPLALAAALVYGIMKRRQMSRRERARREQATRQIYRAEP